MQSPSLHPLVQWLGQFHTGTCSLRPVKRVSSWWVQMFRALFVTLPTVLLRQVFMAICVVAGEKPTCCPVGGSGQEYYFVEWHLHDEQHLRDPITGFPWLRESSLIDDAGIRDAWQHAAACYARGPGTIPMMHFVVHVRVRPFQRARAFRELFLAGMRWAFFVGLVWFAYRAASLQPGGAGAYRKPVLTHWQPNTGTSLFLMRILSYTWIIGGKGFTKAAKLALQWLNHTASMKAILAPLASVLHVYSSVLHWVSTRTGHLPLGILTSQKHA